MSTSKSSVAPASTIVTVLNRGLFGRRSDRKGWAARRLLVHHARVFELQQADAPRHRRLVPRPPKSRGRAPLYAPRVLFQLGSLAPPIASAGALRRAGRPEIWPAN